MSCPNYCGMTLARLQLSYSQETDSVWPQSEGCDALLTNVCETDTLKAIFKESNRVLIIGQ